MSFVADTHVHVYPCYSPGLALRALAANLGRLAEGSGCVAFLAERADCHFFSDLRAGRVSVTDTGLQMAPAAEPEALELRAPAVPPVYLLAGRQVVTAERIELLALTTDAAIPDGLPAAEAIERIAAAGGIPVLSWAPGKWFFGRGAVVRQILQQARPGQLLVGDTALRPTLWGEPRLMRLASERGLGIVAGSDPLPFAGEELRMGTYATRLDGDVDPGRPVTSIRAALCALPPAALRCGRRCGPVGVGLRLVKNALSKR